MLFFILKAPQHTTIHYKITQLNYAGDAKTVTKPMEICFLWGVSRTGNRCRVRMSDSWLHTRKKGEQRKNFSREQNERSCLLGNKIAVREAKVKKFIHGVHKGPHSDRKTRRVLACFLLRFHLFPLNLSKICVLQFEHEAFKSVNQW